MKWYKFENKRPKNDEIVLIKIKDQFIKYSDSPKYYVVKTYNPCNPNLEFEYIEASGEEYSGWYESELEGWCPSSEIERCEEWN